MSITRWASARTRSPVSRSISSVSATADSSSSNATVHSLLSTRTLLPSLNFPLDTWRTLEGYGSTAKVPVMTQ